MSNEIALSRRHFLRNSGIFGAGAGLLAVAPNAFAKAASGKEKILSFYNIHTGERLAAPFWENGEYLQDAIAEISHVLRDHRSGEAMPMDKKLFEYLYKLQQVVGSSKRFEVISGYRSPKSNKQLRSQDSKGVAKKSFHMKGRAIDVRLPGTELAMLQNAARKLQLGGVGYYPKSNFVHLDTGWARSWKG